MIRRLDWLVLLLLLVPATSWGDHERPFTKEELEESIRIHQEILPPEQQQIVKDLEQRQRLLGPIVPAPPPPTPEEFERMKDENDAVFEAMPECPPREQEQARIQQELLARKGKPITPQEGMQSAMNRKDPEWQKTHPPCADKEIKEQRRQMHEDRKRPHPAKDPSALTKMREEYRRFKEQQQAPPQ